MTQPETPNIFQRTMAKRNEGGFTLIELLIVIIILAILAAIVVFAVGNTNSNAIASSCNADAKSVETALEAYKAQIGSYPTSPVAQLTSSTTVTVNGVSEVVGPWLKAWPGSANYNISADSSGTVYVESTGAAAYTTFDGSGGNPCDTL